jgi:hypothetical protein
MSRRASFLALFACAVGVGGFASSAQATTYCVNTSAATCDVHQTTDPDEVITTPTLGDQLGFALKLARQETNAVSDSILLGSGTYAAEHTFEVGGGDGSLAISGPVDGSALISADENAGVTLRILGSVSLSHLHVAGTNSAVTGNILVPGSWGESELAVDHSVLEGKGVEGAATADLGLGFTTATIDHTTIVNTGADGSALSARGGDVSVQYSLLRSAGDGVVAGCRQNRNLMLTIQRATVISGPAAEDHPLQQTCTLYDNGLFGQVRSNITGSILWPGSTLLHTGAENDSSINELTIDDSRTSGAPQDAGSATYVPGSHMTVADPGFAGAADFHLTANSALIDFVAAPGLLGDTDLDGSLARRDGNRDGSAIADAGAYEFVPEVIACGCVNPFFPVPEPTPADPTPAPVPPAPASVFTGFILPKLSLRMDGKGHAPVNLTCPSSAAVSCKGSVTLSITAKPKKGKPGVVSYLGTSDQVTIPTGATAPAPLKLMKKYRGLVKAAGLKVNASARATDAAGTVRTTTGELKIKPAVKQK